MSAGAPPTRAADFDPLEPAFARDPHPTWAELRDRCPVARGAHWDFWALTRYADITRASRAPDAFTSVHGITVPRNPVSGRRAPLHYDPPEHPRYRRPLNRVLSQERADALEPRIRAEACALARDLVAGGGGEAVAALASPLPGLVFGMLIGIPRERALELNRHGERFEWAQGHREAGIAEEENLFLYDALRTLVAERRADPHDPGEELISALLAVRIDDAPLDDEFIAGSIRQLLIAAHVAPAAATASAFAHLAGDPELQARLRAQPALIPRAADELLRLYTPNQGFARTATRDTEIGGCPIQGGEQVALVLTAANRDPEVFEEPDTFRLDRAPSPHIAFGHGSHKCAGRAFAEAELRIALEELLRATSSFTLAGDPSWLGWPLYGPETLPLRCVPAA
jgi:cytochrome P450